MLTYEEYQKLPYEPSTEKRLSRLLMYYEMERAEKEGREFSKDGVIQIAPETERLLNRMMGGLNPIYARKDAADPAPDPAGE